MPRFVRYLQPNPSGKEYVENVASAAVVTVAFCGCHKSCVLHKNAEKPRIQSPAAQTVAVNHGDCACW